MARSRKLVPVAQKVRKPAQLPDPEFATDANKQDGVAKDDGHQKLFV